MTKLNITQNADNKLKYVNYIKIHEIIVISSQTLPLGFAKASIHSSKNW